MQELRIARSKAGMTLMELEAASGVGASTISKIERGVTQPQATTLHKLADALGVEVSELYPKDRAPSPEPSLFNGLEDERRRTFVQSCRRYAEARAAHYERRLAEAHKGGVFAGHEGARILFETAFEEYDELRPLFGRDLAYLFVEGLSDYEASRFSGLVGPTLFPLAKTVERIADRAAELAETEAQKAEVERRREEMRRSA